jgi:hypothetical protein
MRVVARGSSLLVTCLICAITLQDARAFAPLKSGSRVLASSAHNLNFPPRHPVDSVGGITCASRAGVARIGLDSPLLHASNKDDVLATPAEESQSCRGRTIAVGALWAAFLSYAFLLSPGRDPVGAAADAALLSQMIVLQFPPVANRAFFCLFNALGVLPFVYALLLLPGSKDQKVPALPFVAGSFALGFFGLGPYLALRESRETIEEEDMGRVARFFNSRLGAAFFTLPLTLAILFVLLSPETLASVPEYLDMCRSQMLVNVSSIDFLILSLLIWEPMREDMLRRGVDPSALRLAGFSFPLLGPVAWVLARPQLQNRANSSTE